MTRFETETCSRCGGSGRHSFCEAYRDICFKCSGSGKQLTKRGAAAKAWAIAKRMVKVETLKPGDSIKNGTMKIKVTKIYTDPFDLAHPSSSLKDGVMVKNAPYLTIEGGPKGYGCKVFPGTEVELLPNTKAELEIEMAAAIAYQDSLTKQGKPRKGKA